MSYRLVFVSVLMPCVQAFGHHSDAGVDMETIVQFDGTVTEYSWRNPHVYFNVMADNESGQSTEWEIQLPSTVTMTRMGWTRDSLSR